MNPFTWLVWGLALLVLLFIASAAVAAVHEAVKNPRCIDCKRDLKAVRKISAASPNR